MKGPLGSAKDMCEGWKDGLACKGVCHLDPWSPHNERREFVLGLTHELYNTYTHEKINECDYKL